MTKREIRAFQARVYEAARQEARRLPWRPPTLRERADGSIDPYKVLVSELMLQQTQVSRVIPAFQRFCKAYPTVRVLADAKLFSVLIAWQGLGYNRRAKHLHACAKEIVRDHRGRVPRAREALVSLPGIGTYTAGAIRAFAFNEPDVFIETNIRTVFTHHFFNDASGVHDRDLLPLIEATLDHKHPRAWYAALMDYGTALKRDGIKINAKSAHYTKQSTFHGSDRQIRGAILRILAQSGARSRDALVREIGSEPARVDTQLAALLTERFITKNGRMWRLGE